MDVDGPVVVKLTGEERVECFDEVLIDLRVLVWVVILADVAELDDCLDEETGAEDVEGRSVDETLRLVTEDLVVTAGEGRDDRDIDDLAPDELLGVMVLVIVVNLVLVDLVVLVAGGRLRPVDECSL